MLNIEMLNISIQKTAVINKVGRRYFFNQRFLRFAGLVLTMVVFVFLTPNMFAGYAYAEEKDLFNEEDSHEVYYEDEEDKEDEEEDENEEDEIVFYDEEIVYYREHLRMIFDQVNDERAKAGLLPYIWDEGLYQCSVIRANEIMYDFSSLRPYGARRETVLKELGYDCPYSFGENIARTREYTPDLVMRAWMGSSVNRENILSSEFNTFSVAIAEDLNGSYTYVQHFSSRETPYILDGAPEGELEDLADRDDPEGDPVIYAYGRDDDPERDMKGINVRVYDPEGDPVIYTYERDDDPELDTYGIIDIVRIEIGGGRGSGYMHVRQVDFRVIRPLSDNERIEHNTDEDEYPIEEEIYWEDVDFYDEDFDDFESLVDYDFYDEENEDVYPFDEDLYDEDWESEYSWFDEDYDFDSDFDFDDELDDYDYYNELDDYDFYDDDDLYDPYYEDDWESDQFWYDDDSDLLDDFDFDDDYMTDDDTFFSLQDYDTNDDTGFESAVFFVLNPLDGNDLTAGGNKAKNNAQTLAIVAIIIAALAFFIVGLALRKIKAVPESKNQHVYGAGPGRLYKNSSPTGPGRKYKSYAGARSGGKR